jgi:5-methylcytosine-specific restriction endonuclease McrA
MLALCSLSDSELVARLPALVKAERHALLDVIEHLVEVERRRLYLTQAVSSLYRYCIQRLGYAEDAALKRHRVARLALRLPQVLEELRAGTMHLTGLFLLATHLTEDNAATLLGEARGKSRRQIEELIAHRFPRPDVPSSLEPLSPEVSGPVGTELLLLGGASPSRPGSPPVTCSKTGELARARLEPLSPTRLRVEFTARAELYEKLEKARELLSHALPSGDLGGLFERALDALIEQETRKRFGAETREVSKPRKPRKLKPGSRHVPVKIERKVWKRDKSQCTFVDREGRRCAERRFLTLEHRTPFALGGPSTFENLCLLCSAHNLENARQIFGEAHIETKIRARTPVATVVATETQSAEEQPLETVRKVLSSLSRLGFPRNEASAVVAQALGSEPRLDVEQLLRKCLLLLVPKAS